MNTLWAVDEVPFSSWILFILHLRPLTVSQCEQYKIFYKRGFISLISIQQIKQNKTKKGGGDFLSLMGVLAPTLLLSPNSKERKRNVTKPKQSPSLDIHKGSTYGHLRQETIEIWKEEQYLQAGSKPFPHDCCEVLSSAGWDRGGWGWADLRV